MVITLKCNNKICQAACVFIGIIICIKYYLMDYCTYLQFKSQVFNKKYYNFFSCSFIQNIILQNIHAMDCRVSCNFQGIIWCSSWAITLCLRSIRYNRRRFFTQITENEKDFTGEDLKTKHAALWRFRGPVHINHTGRDGKRIKHQSITARLFGNMKKSTYIFSRGHLRSQCGIL